MFEQPAPLDDNQRHFIKLFLDRKCTGGYLATHLGVSWKDAQAMIEQYKKEGNKEEALPSEDTAIIAQSADPAVMNSWENELVNQSPWRGQRDGDGEPPIFA